MLDEKLESYGQQDVYPFHMPGHKRISLGSFDPYTVDITEIEGFDNLHDPTGLIKELEEGYADLYGAEEAYLLVNGSTAGIMTALFSAISREEEVLLARNCHGSVYHGAMLRNALVRYVYPGSFSACVDIPGEICPEELEVTLREHGEIRAVVITSPTYEGVISDIRSIAETVHRHGAKLIVDAAHGAHLGPNGMESPLSLGADLVVVSLHKTLPAFTSTALLLKRKGCGIDSRRIRLYLDCFQTSSPSYILMAGASKCLRYLKEYGKKGFREYQKHLEEFYSKTADLRRIRVLPSSDRDPGKIIILGNDHLTGKEIADRLRRDFSIETEMACGTYCLAMTSVMDTKEGFLRLSDALKRIDETIPDQLPTSIKAGREGDADSEQPLEMLYTKEPVIVMTLSEAAEERQSMRLIEATKDCISGGFVSFYPPGIPILCPGELITGEIIRQIKIGMDKGLTATGVKEGQIAIVTE